MTVSVGTGHPFFFPTQVAMVDDDQDFLEGISLMLEGDMSHKLFNSASEALKYVNTAQQNVNILPRCYSSYKTGPMASDSLTHVDIAKLHQEIVNPNRFSTVSTLVVDYSMPEMNGLELLASLKNPFVKKILLTGKGDMEMAVKAFNSQLIDQFIDKHDPSLKSRLNAAINAFQDQYFRNSFKLVTDQIIANNHDGFLSSPDFQAWFSELRLKHNIVEYYLIDEPHSGFLLADAWGKCSILLIHTEESLQEHIHNISQFEPAPELVEKLGEKKLLPVFEDKLKSLSKDSKYFRDWKSHYISANQIIAAKNFYTAFFPAERYPLVKPDRILSFNAHLQGLLPANEVLH